MKNYFRLAFVLALALVSWWFQDFMLKSPILKQPKDAHFPDYFMENFTVTSMDSNGKSAYVLKAQRLQHFSDDDSVEISLPIIEFKDTNGDWSISANRAQILKDKNIIHLYENVLIERLQSETSTPLNISTSYLTINTLNRIVETDQQAHIKTHDAELDTLGMVFNGKQGILNLQSKVKGFYEPSQ
jgi:lipopolysaccharide export system protein LptC